MLTTNVVVNPRPTQDTRLTHDRVDELGTWRLVRYKLGKPYIEAYHKHFPVSPPVEDYDDRNALYAIPYNLHASALYKGNLSFRNM